MKEKVKIKKVEPSIVSGPGLLKFLDKDARDNMVTGPDGPLTVEKLQKFFEGIWKNPDPKPKEIVFDVEELLKTKLRIEMPQGCYTIKGDSNNSRATTICTGAGGAVAYVLEALKIAQSNGLDVNKGIKEYLAALTKKNSLININKLFKYTSLENYFNYTK
jgi:hypothetical protein